MTYKEMQLVKQDSQKLLKEGLNKISDSLIASDDQYTSQTLISSAQLKVESSGARLLENNHVINSTNEDDDGFIALQIPEVNSQDEHTSYIGSTLVANTGANTKS